MAERPLNILWISLEDTSPRFGCTGDPVARTPRIDALAGEGCRWPNAFSVAGVCAPSRSAIITGMYPTSIGAMHMRTAHTLPDMGESGTPYECCPPAFVKVFPEYLRAAGYFTTNAYKCDYQFQQPLTGFDECMSSPSGEPHWRNRPDPTQPFMSIFNFGGTHESGMWAKEGETIETDPDALEIPPYLPDTPESRLALARHYDNLARADEFVGRLLDELEADGLADSTIVIIWSDHGEGLPRKKRWPYDGGIKIPLIVRWPGQIAPGTVSDDLVSLIDLAPTMLNLAGVGIPAHLQGQIFLGPDAAPPREYIYASRDRYDESYDMIRAARSARFKYLRNYHSEKSYLLSIPYRNRHQMIKDLYRMKREGTLSPEQALFMAHSRPPEELYDIQADPHELNNLADDPAHREDLATMSAAVDAWMLRIADMGHIPEREMVERWWPNGVQPSAVAPRFVIFHDEDCGQTRSSGGTFAGPAEIELYCSTQGASIAYTLSDEPEPGHWSLYTGPISLPTGTTAIRAKAVRIGYKDSAESVGRFTVT